MRKNSKVRTTVTALATVATLGAATLVAPVAYAAEAPTCQLSLTTPVIQYRTATTVIIQTIARRTGCVQNREWIKARLRRNISGGSDETLSEMTVTDKVNISFRVSKQCGLNETSSTTVHADMSTNAGGSAKSSNVTFEDYTCL
jgi:hypothetical protein